MMIDNTGLDGVKSDLAFLDETAEKAGFVRWQWEYYRATYEYKIEDNKTEYYVRMNTRVVEGKLEKPDTILVIEAVYMGKATFPHGLDYETPIPTVIQGIANKKLQQFKEMLEA